MVTEYDWILCISRWCNFMLIETCAFGKFGNTYLSKGELIGMVETPPYSNDSLSSTCFAFIYIYTIFIYIYVYMGMTKSKSGKQKRKLASLTPQQMTNMTNCHSIPCRRATKGGPKTHHPDPVSGTNYNGRHYPFKL